MEDIKKERLILSIITLAGVSCILQNYFGNWEFWVPAVVLVGCVILWWIHITESLDHNVRANMYFAYVAFLLFYHGIHYTSFYDVSIVIGLSMATFSILNRPVLINLIFAEYVVIMVIQFCFLFKDENTVVDAFTGMRIAFHIITILSMFVFIRLTISGWIFENNRLEDWMKTVKENKNDMEDFLSNISHELRTPVNVISGMTTLLRKEKDNNSLVSIQEAVIRLIHQIEDIQDYTEIKRGELVLMEENYMCISLINDVVSNYDMTYKNTDLDLVIDLDPETPTMLRGDIQKLHKLFRHLLDNAIKFTKRGGVYIRVFSIPRDYGVNLTIEITDTGIGMTRADMGRLSKGMYQANKKRNRSTGGIGIGLPIVYGFVHKMGGFVQISSEKRRGTTVRLSIPQTVVDPTPCLAIKDAGKDRVVLYSKPESFKLPEVRDFNRSMVINLAKGLKTRLYSTGDTGELQRLIKRFDLNYIFAGQHEYETDKELLDRLASEGIKVVVTRDNGQFDSYSSNISVIPKPLYAFPIVRILNGEGSYDICDIDKVKPSYDGVRALIVDDEPMNLVVASGLLSDYKMQADTAESGREAIEKYEGSDYDLVFMDHMMPEMDGVETMKRIRDIANAEGRTIRIVALTANALSGAREMFMKEGFDGFIAKPIDIAEFERVMDHILPEEMIRRERRA